MVHKLWSDAGVCLHGGAFAADYQVGLDPMPLDDETKQFIAGRGAATVTSDDKTIRVKAPPRFGLQQR